MCHSLRKQHIHLVWVHDAVSKTHQRGSWWANRVMQARLDFWEECLRDNIKLCTTASQREMQCLGFLDDDYRLPNHFLLSCHPSTQNTRFAPSWQIWLPWGLTLLLAAGICCSRHHSWSCHLCPRQLPLCIHCWCTSSAGKGKACPQCQAPCYNYAATNKGVIRCRFRLSCCSAWKWKGVGWDVYSEAIGNTFKRLLHWATADSIRKGITKNISIQYCSYPMVYSTWSSHLDAMQARTLHDLHRSVTVVTSVCCLGSGHSKCNCRLHLPDSSLYHQFYWILQNQF